MRQTIIVVASTAFVTAIVASWGTAAIIAQSPKNPGVIAPAVSKSVDVMQLMKNAKNLPEESYDSH